MKKQFITSLLVIACFGLSVFSGMRIVWAKAITTQETDTIPRIVADGETFYQKGDMGHAAKLWEQAVALMNPETDTLIYLTTLIHLTDAYKAIGHHHKALRELENALPVVEKNKDLYQNALFYGSLGELHLSMGNRKEARLFLEKGKDMAEQANHLYAMPTIFNSMGNLLTSEEKYSEAIESYEKSLGLIESQKAREEPALRDLKATVLINKARLFCQIHKEKEISEAIENARIHIENMPDSHDKARNLISLGLVVSESANGKDGFSNSAIACQLFSNAAKIAEKLQDNRTRSYALGYMGQLYESEKRYSEAKKLTRQAIFFAGNLPRTRYLWEWQLGRLCKAEENIEDAAEAYQQAIDTLTPVRWEVMNDYRSLKNPFYEKIRPVYLGLTELLLKQAEMITDGNAKEEKLKAAVDIIELMKKAELQNFFHDECVTELQKKMTLLDRAPANTAILYPVLLPDSLSLLLTLPDSMKHFSVPINSDLLTKSIREFQTQVQSRRSYTYKTSALRLYDWLIRPIHPELVARNVDTLIVAPDSLLRLIPFAALYDGTQYLVENYAVVTVPAITLTDMTPIGRQNFDLLAGGLSEARQGFDSLPNVPEELKTIRKTIGGRTLIDKDYTADNLTGEFREQAYPVVHLATHGVFGSSAKESFLLTYDDRLTMDGLEQLIGMAKFREHPVELITLSACQTAIGDERAAMGLAGVAVKAGARSAIATLWSVNDESTYIAVSEFYRQLKIPGMSKAKALQNAQKKLIADRMFQHPLYWAPFLLIGNWM